MTLLLIAALAVRPRSPSARSSRGMPQRSPYSTQLKLATLGTGSTPWGADSRLRGRGRSNGQCSTLTTTWTISGLPPGAGGTTRSSSISNGMRGLGAPGSGRASLTGLDAFAWLVPPEQFRRREMEHLIDEQAEESDHRNADEGVFGLHPLA